MRHARARTAKPEPASTGPLDPAAIPLPAAARELSRLSGTTITEAMLQADIGAGAPTNLDGSINLVLYAAWLVREMGASGGD